MQQETLDQLRKAMHNTRILCAVMLDTKVHARAPYGACARLMTSPCTCVDGPREEPCPGGPNGM